MTEEIFARSDVTTRMTFRDPETAELYDPDVVTMSWRLHAGPETLWTFGVGSEVVRDSLGKYHAVVPDTAAGLHYFRFRGTGPGDIAIAKESYFAVRTWFDQEGS